MNQAVDSPVIVLFEDRPKQGMVFQLNLSIYLDARVTMASNLKDLKKALAGPDGIHLVITRATIKGAPLTGKILEFLESSNAPVPVICLGDEKERPGLTVVSSETEVKPMLQAAARILGITARHMVAKQRPDTYEIAPEFLNMLFTFPCDVLDRGVTGAEKLFTAGDTVPRNKVSQLVKEGRPLLIATFDRLKLVNAVTEQSLRATDELSSQLPDDRKMTLLSASLDMVAAQFQNAGMDEDTVKLANASIKAVEKIASSAASVNSLVKQLLDTQGGYRYAHCQLITFLGFHVIKMMNWWGDEQRSTFSQAAFYHDISLATDEQAMVRTAKAAEQFTAKGAAKEPRELELLLTHAQLAARELQTAPEITPEVVQVVIQHHGSSVGRGFSTDIAKLDPLAKTFVLSEEWGDYLMDLAQNDKPADNDAKLRELKSIYKDEQSCQIIETFRYLDPAAFMQDFLVADEVEFAKSLIAGGAAGSEAQSVVIAPAKEAESETRVKAGQAEKETETLVKGPVREPRLADLAKVQGEAGDKAREILAKIHEKRPQASPEEIETLLKAGGVTMPEEARKIVAAELEAESEISFGADESEPEASTKIDGVTEHIDHEKITVKGAAAEAESQQKIGGVTEHRTDEKVTIKGDKPQDLVDRSIVRIKGDPQEKARELKMKTLAGSTDLMKAAITGDAPKVAELLGAGESPQMQLRKTDAEGRTVVHYAAMSGSVAVLKFLVEKGAQVNTVDSKRRSALFFTALYKHNDAFDFLITQNGKVTQQALGGMTVAMIAASNGNLHVLKTALARGARVDTKDQTGKTALDYAKQSKNAEAIAFLEEQSKPAADAGREKESTAAG